MNLALPPLAQIGLIVDAVGALIVLLPELPCVRTHLTDYGRVDDLNGVATTVFRRVANRDRGLIYAVESEDDPVGEVVQSRVGFYPTAIEYGVDPDADTGHIDIHRESGETYPLDEPTQFVQWIRTEQDRLRQARKGKLLLLGAGLIAIGFGIQYVGA